MKKKETLIIASVIILIVMGLIFSNKPKVETKQDDKVDVIISNDIIVQIIGEVNKPGVYELSSDSRLLDLIQVAGGLTENASDDINLVQKLTDGMIIKISKKTTKQDNNINKISINNATVEELMSLKGIGEVTAVKIVEHRNLYGPFLSINDLKKISGISEKIFSDNIENIML